MTSKASLNNFHPALNLYRYSVKRTLGLTVLITVFLLLVCPGYTLMLINNELKHNYTGGISDIYNFDALSNELVMLVTAVTTAAALLYLFINFAFLYGRSSGDFFHSLPLKRKGLLFSRFFASLAPLTVPMVLTYASMCGILSLDNVEGSFKPIILGFVFNILIMLSCCAFSMIFIVCAGSTFDLIVSFFTFNVGMIFVQLICCDLCREFLTGFPSGSMRNFLYFSTPFFYSFAKCYTVLTDEIDIAAQAIIFIAKLALITVISLIAAYLLYKRRKSEKSGVSYAYRFIYIICGVIVGIVGAYGLGMVFSNGTYNVFFWIFAVIGGLLAAVTFGAINDRGFKTVKKSLIMGGCSTAAVALACLLLWSGGFGYTSKIPSEDSIKSVEVRFNKCDAVFDDPTLPIKLHKAIIDGSDDFSYENYLDTVYINYTLENGSKLCREFEVDNENADILLEIFKSSENIKSVRKELDDLDLSNLSIYVYGDDDEFIDGAYLTTAELKKIAEAYISDIPNATSETIMGSYDLNFEIQGIDSDNQYRYRDFYIDKSFENTLNAIESLNLKERVSADDTEKIEK